MRVEICVGLFPRGGIWGGIATRHREAFASGGIWGGFRPNAKAPITTGTWGGHHLRRPFSGGI